MKLRMTICLCLSLALPGGAFAADFWVLGSYRAEESAARERDRLSKILPTTVSTIEAGTGEEKLIRLVVQYPGSGELRARLDASLGLAGIENPWRLSGPGELRLPPKSLKPQRTDASNAARVYLVVSDVTDIQTSIELERRLDQAFTGVTTQSLFEGGALYYRLMIGPVAREDVDAMLNALSNMGLSDVWQLPSEEVSAGTDGTVARMRVRPSVRSSVEVPRVQGEASGKRSGFNFATLCTPESKDEEACGSRE